MNRTHAAFALTLLLSALGLGASCKRAPAAPALPPKTPTLRIYLVTSVAGALEPCGCVKDMLGGLDHAAALAKNQLSGAHSSVFLAAGPLFFLDPALDSDRKTQLTWKAEAIAESLEHMGLVAWAPGANDWAGGAEQLAALREKSKATLLAANLSGASAGAQATRVVEVAGIKLGIAGVSTPVAFGKAPLGVEAKDPRPALEDTKRTLDAAGAKLKIALLALPRGDAMRLAESVSGFQLFVVGKPFERGDTNDGSVPAVVVNDTLVVQTSNHLQSMAIVDLYVRGDDFTFEDATGLAQQEKRESLRQRIADLKSRIADGDGNGSKAEDLAARRAELQRLEIELKGVDALGAPAEGSFFRYSTEPVRESDGTEAQVKERMKGYYKRVNEHNKTAFAERRPAPVPVGQAGYIGSEKCAVCHPTQQTFWQSQPHTRAYVPLEQEEKQFNLDCVGCHVTGYDKPGGSTVTWVDGLKGVQCEVCHGPGSLHAEHTKVKEYLLEPGRNFCASECHHPPHVNSDWSVDEAWKRIIGPGHGQKK